MRHASQLAGNCVIHLFIAMADAAFASTTGTGIAALLPDAAYDRGHGANTVNVLLVEELVKSLSGLRIASEPTGTAGVARALSLRPGELKPRSPARRGASFFFYHR